MTTSQGLGRRKAPLFRLQPFANLFSLNDDARVLAEELYWGGYPPTPTDIPYTWIRGPFRAKQDTPLRQAEVTQSGGTTARAKDSALTSTDRVWPFTATIDTVVPPDPGNLAKWVIDYYQDPRPRNPSLTLILNVRSEAEIYRILAVKQGTRISISGAPSGWPTGAGELVVEGIQHSIMADLRTVTWNTTPVIGAAVGSSGPWFYTDDSRLSSSTDLVPF